MRLLVAFLPALACVGLMYACMRMMMSGSHRAEQSKTSQLETRVRELESELDRSRTERDDRLVEV